MCIRVANSGNRDLCMALIPRVELPWNLITSRDGRESTRLPPMWPGFDSQNWRHTRVEFVGFLLCLERFSPGYLVFPSKNQHTI